MHGLHLYPVPRWISGRDTTAEPAIALQGYRLCVQAGTITLTAHDAAGAFYGAQTLAQLHQHYPHGIPVIVVVDAPAIAIRGVMLDVSRDKMPTTATLEHMLDRLATLRYNVLVLYLEHTFAHPGHDEVWQAASPFTAEEIAHLRAYARARHITLVPQQNALGHMERWLKHPRYAHLAALPGGYHAPNGDHEPAACLEPRNPQSFSLIEELLTNVATTFDAPFVHIGLDEPIDLNPAVWDAIFDVPGAVAPWADIDNGAFCVPLSVDRLNDYTHWVRRIHQIPSLAQRRLLMWADVLAPNPDVIPRIPSDMTLIEWGYDAHHPFDARVGRLKSHGHRCWVAPGTATWDSMAGRVDMMVANVDGAVEAAITHGCEGLLMCEWGNAGHVHHAAISWPGFVYAAVKAWNPASAVDLTDALATITYDTQLARATIHIGRLDRRFAPSVPGAGTLASILVRPGTARQLAEQGLTPSMLDAAWTDVTDVLRECASTTIPRRIDDGDIWHHEITTTAKWMKLAIARAQHELGWPSMCTADEMTTLHTSLLNEYPTLWLARNRPGGMQDSLDKLTAMVASSHA